MRARRRIGPVDGKRAHPAEPSAEAVPPGGYIEKEWRFVIPAAGDRRTADVGMAHNRSETPIAFEGMQYAVGPLAGQSGGFGFSGAWVNEGARAGAIALGSLAYPSNTFTRLPAGNKFAATGDSGAAGAIRRSLASTIGDSEGAVTRWFSVLIRPESDAGFAGLRIFGTGGTMILGWKNGVFAFDRFGTGGTGAGLSTVPVASSIGTPVLLVGRVDFSGHTGFDRLSLYINPGPTQPLLSQAAAQVQDLDYGNVGRIGIEWSHPAFADELQVARTYAALVE